MCPKFNEPDVKQQLFAQIMRQSEQWKCLDIPNDAKEEFLPTAPQLAKILGVRLEWVKKQLRFLTGLCVIEAVSAAPKRYRINFRHLEGIDTEMELADFNFLKNYSIRS